jgi:hypothetical protein
VRGLLKILPNFITTPNRGAYLHAMLSLNPSGTSPARNRCHLPLSSSRSAHMGGTHTTLSLGLLPSLSLVNFFSYPTSSSRAHAATLRSPTATSLAAAPPGPGWIPSGSDPSSSASRIRTASSRIGWSPDVLLWAVPGGRGSRRRAPASSYGWIPAA